MWDWAAVSDIILNIDPTVGAMKRKTNCSNDVLHNYNEQFWCEKIISYLFCLPFFIAMGACLGT